MRYNRAGECKLPSITPIESAIARRFKFTRHAYYALFGYAYRAMQAFPRDESVASQVIAGVVVPVARILRAPRKPTG